MSDNYIGMSIYAVYGDDFIEPVTKEHAIITEKKDNYYLAKDDNGIEFTVDMDGTFNNFDFDSYIGTDYRVFTDENKANDYFDYLKKHVRGYYERFHLC